MKPFFTQIGYQKLKTFCHAQTLFAFDYDGTLTSLSPHIFESKLPLKTKKLLENLYQYVPIAIISGRSIADLKTLCSFTPTFFMGNHGLEGIKLDKKLKIRFLRMCKQWKEKLSKNMTNIQGLKLEDKQYSLSIHYRSVKQKKKIKHLLLNHVSKLKPSPKIVFGKSVINLLPVCSFNKGTSLMEAMKQLNATHAIYIGDDDTDEDIFGLPGNEILKIRVGKKNNSYANFYLKNQFELNRFLNETLDIFVKK